MCVFISFTLIARLVESDTVYALFSLALDYNTLKLRHSSILKRLRTLFYLSSFYNLFIPFCPFHR